MGRMLQPATRKVKYFNTIEFMGGTGQLTDEEKLRLNLDE